MNQGVIYMLASSFSFSVMAVMVKLAGESLPNQEIVLVRAALSLVFSYALIRRAGIAPLGGNRPLLLLRGLFGYCALSCLVYSLTHLPLAEATVIQYLHPTFTALLAAVALRERISIRIMGVGVVSLLGVALVAQPEFLTSVAPPLSGTSTPVFSTIVLVVAVGGAFFSSAAYVVVRRLSRSEDPLVIVFYFPLVSVPATLPFVWSNAVLPSGMEWLYLLAIGATSQAGQIWLTRGLARLPAARGTAITYAQVVFATLWGVFFFSEIPSAWTGVGALLIVSGTLCVALSPGMRSAVMANAAEATKSDASPR